MHTIVVAQSGRARHVDAGDMCGLHVVRGLSSGSDTTRAQVMLRREGQQPEC